MSAAVRAFATSLQAARQQLRLAADLATMAISDMEGERRSTLRYGYLVNRALGTAALDRAEWLSWRVPPRFAQMARRDLGVALDQHTHLAELERHAMDVGAVSIALLLDEVAEQITDRDLKPYVDIVADYGKQERPLEDLVLSTDEKLRISEYTYERVSRGLALDSIAELELLADREGGSVRLSSAPPPLRRQVGLPPHPAGWQQAYNRAFTILHADSERTHADDLFVRQALRADGVDQLRLLMRGWFSPFFDPRDIDLPPVAASPVGRLF